MVEPISMAVGTALGVAGLYSLCLQAMDQFEDGKNFEKDSQKLYSLFQAEKFLLKKWGEKVGVLAEDESKRHHYLRHSADEYPVVRNILHHLTTIWSDYETLSHKYGIDTSRPDYPGKPGTIAKSDSGQNKTSLRRRFIWASKDKKKFGRLLGDVGAFIQKLYNVVPIGDGDDGLKDLALYLKLEGEKQLDFRSDMRAHVDHERRKECLDWIGAISTDNEYDEAKRERSPGTCTWLQSNNQFLDWFGPPYSLDSSRVLWLYGGPGIGKTFLSASIVEFLKEYSARATASFFCTHEHPSKRQTGSILRSWIVQLAVQHDEALEVIKKFKPDGPGEAVPSKLWEILSEILVVIGSCHLLVDGFDECLDYDPASRARQEGARELFLERLLSSTEATGAKIIIVSRDLADIRSAFKTAPARRISKHAISVADTAQDITLVSRAIAESKIKDPAQKDKVADQLSTNCHGMFLWLRLGGVRLSRGMLPAHVERTLNSMPSGLNQAYGRNLEEIMQKEEYYRDRAKIILRWILFAFRPLSVVELLQVLEIELGSFQTDSSYVIDDDVIEAEILGLCGSLVEVRNDGSSNSAGDRTVHFIHFSAKEFLLGGQNECGSHVRPLFFPDAGNEHGILHTTCLSALFLTPKQSVGMADSLLKYFSDYWANHFDQSTGESRSRCISAQKRLFVAGPAFQTFVARTTMSDRLGMTARESALCTTLTALEAACLHGLYDTCKELSMNYNVAPQEALSIAALSGKESIFQLLLNRGDLDVNLSGHKGDPKLTPLRIASRYGHQAIVRLLLEKKEISIDQSDSLRIAALEGHVAVVQCLLARKEIDVNRQWEGTGETALYAAVSRGHVQIVRLLLSREDLDVNLRSEGQTALHRAARQKRSNTELVPLLLGRKDIAVNALDGWGRTPLDRAMKGLCLGPPARSSDHFLRLRGGKTSIELRTERQVDNLKDNAPQQHTDINPTISGYDNLPIAPPPGAQDMLDHVVYDIHEPHLNCSSPAETNRSADIGPTQSSVAASPDNGTDEHISALSPVTQIIPGDVTYDIHEPPPNCGSPTEPDFSAHISPVETSVIPLSAIVPERHNTVPSHDSHYRKSISKRHYLQYNVMTMFFLFIIFLYFLLFPNGFN